MYSFIAKLIWPGEYIEINQQDDVEPDAEYTIEPSSDAKRVQRQMWPHLGVLSSVAMKYVFPT